LNKETRKLPNTTFRYKLRQGDPERIRYLAQATDFFNDAEIRVAEELAQERLSKGSASGYHFVMVGRDDSLLGYTCYGPIACTLSSYDIYWIAVHPDRQGAGLGRRLIEETERMIRKGGGTRIYVETSQRPQYNGTRAFYKSMGYRPEAVVPDFYAPGDGKIIFCKVLT
jgi:GNAT superfamily N-acetyltransferase